MEPGLAFAPLYIVLLSVPTPNSQFSSSQIKRNIKHFL